MLHFSTPEHRSTVHVPIFRAAPLTQLQEMFPLSWRWYRFRSQGGVAFWFLASWCIAEHSLFSRHCDSHVDFLLHGGVVTSGRCGTILTSKYSQNPFHCGEYDILFLSIDFSSTLVRLRPGSSCWICVAIPWIIWIPVARNVCFHVNFKT